MYIIVSASPNSDGLTAACVTAAMTGFHDVGADVQHIDLCTMSIDRCRQCGNGWGSCRTEHRCVIKDQLATLQASLTDAQGLVIVTPVYWGEMAESAKCAFDRLRRCEATRGEESLFCQKPVIAVAAAGGSGNGITSCLASMERLIHHTRGTVADLIGITRRSRAYTLVSIRAAAAALAQAE